MKFGYQVIGVSESGRRIKMGRHRSLLRTLQCVRDLYATSPRSPDGGVILAERDVVVGLSITYGYPGERQISMSPEDTDRHAATMRIRGWAEAKARKGA